MITTLSSDAKEILAALIDDKPVRIKVREDEWIEVIDPTVVLIALANSEGSTAVTEYEIVGRR